MLFVEIIKWILNGASKAPILFAIACPADGICNSVYLGKRALWLISPITDDVASAPMSFKKIVISKPNYWTATTDLPVRTDLLGGQKRTVQKKVPKAPTIQVVKNVKEIRAPSSAPSL